MHPHPYVDVLHYLETLCRNLSFGFATKAKGLQSYGLKRSSRQEKARESHHIFPGVLESVREYEGMNLHTPKTTLTLGDEVPKDSQNFREQF